MDTNTNSTFTSERKVGDKFRNPRCPGVWTIQVITAFGDALCINDASGEDMIVDVRALDAAINCRAAFLVS